MGDIDTQLKVLVAQIQSGKKVTFFQGAGISTSAGIPDFRSPKTGLYANLSKFKLPYPEAVFDIDYFKKNPRPFYTLAHELYPGNFLPTKFHYMIKLFQDHGLVHRVYTQNIDTLERIAGIDRELIVEAHGSFAENHCIECCEEMSTEVLKQHMAKKFNDDGIPKCSHCNGLVKPDITFFGEGLPARFFDLWDEDCENVEIAIVAGTSLSVYPFASLPAEVEERALRVLVNDEAVGDFTAGKRKSDILLLDECDRVAEKLVELLGWEQELEELMKKEKLVEKEKPMKNAIVGESEETEVLESVTTKIEALAVGSKENEEVIERTETVTVTETETEVINNNSTQDKDAEPTKTNEREKHEIKEQSDKDAESTKNEREKNKNKEQSDKDVDAIDQAISHLKIT